jgi:hypothetical protein
LEQDPHSAPEQSADSPAPFVHAALTPVRKAFKAAYRAFVDAFCIAAECLRAGSNAEFPEGAFPPCAPFVQPQEPTE